MIKALFLDFDGTIYSHKQGKIPDSAYKALKKIKDKNILTFLCTGRAYSELKWFDLSKLDIEGLIVNNGQLIFDRNENIIYQKPIEGVLKEKLIKIFNDKKLPIYISTKDDIFINFVNEQVIKVQNDVSSNIPEIKDYKGQDMFMTSIFVDISKRCKELEELDSLGEITYWHFGACDVVPKGVSKSKGIDEVIKIYGISIEDTMAIGDGENDIDMLKHCGIGIAMGNSNDDVKKVADYITDDIDNDGLYKAFKHYDLI